MQTPAVSLPEPWLEKIWATMRATYGAAFDRQWQTPAGVDPAQHVADLKAVWGRELAPLQRSPHVIAYALANLPEHPPNLVEFRRLCSRSPEPVLPALPVPKADPARVSAAFARLGEIARQSRPDGKAWAHALKAREEAGDNTLTPTQREAWRNALREHLNTTEETDL